MNGCVFMKLEFKLRYKDNKTMGRLGEITYNGKTYVEYSDFPCPTS